MKNTISVRTHIKFEDIKDILDSASRGSSYWADCGSLAYEDTTQAIVGELRAEPIENFEAEKGETKIHHLNLKSIKKGFTVMAKKEPRHFADFISGNYDQITADVFLQCCLLGEVIYG